MQDRQFCEDHPHEMLTTICICSHQCKKKLCPECQYESHRTSDVSEIIPINTYTEYVLDALMQKLKKLKETCNEMENWNNLIKKSKQIFDKIINDITNHKDNLFNKFQNQIQIIEGMKLKLRERSVFELNVQQIEKLSSFIQVTSTIINNEREQQRNQAIEQKNRELLENKIKNLENEIQIIIKPLIFDTKEDNVISSLREVRIRTQKSLSPIVRKIADIQINQHQKVSQQPLLPKLEINNGLNNNNRTNQFQLNQQRQDNPSLTPQNLYKPGRKLNYSESPISQNGQIKPNRISNQPFSGQPTININQPSNIQRNNIFLNTQQNQINSNGFLNNIQSNNQNYNQQKTLAQPKINEEPKTTNLLSKIKIMELPQELAQFHLRNRK